MKPELSHEGEEEDKSYTLGERLLMLLAAMIMGAWIDLLLHVPFWVLEWLNG